MVMDNLDLHPTGSGEKPGTLWIHRVDLNEPENQRKYLIFRERAERMEAYLRRVFGMGEGQPSQPKSCHQPEFGDLSEEKNQPIWAKPLMLLLYLNYMLSANRQCQGQPSALLPLPALLVGQSHSRSYQPVYPAGRFLGENA